MQLSQMYSSKHEISGERIQLVALYLSEEGDVYDRAHPLSPSLKKKKKAERWGLLQFNPLKQMLAF